MTNRTPRPPQDPCAGQLAFDELETPLRDLAFVVVDLETTGTNNTKDAITEIAAIRVRGGEIMGEFSTLVNPGSDIPPYIVQITGITTKMVSAAPRINEVIPSFIDFARDAVLVAHNAPFDVGFLKAAFYAYGFTWPNPRVLCTVTLARRVLTRDEAPSVKLSALAHTLRLPTKPTHRALDDARATVEVLHTLIERVGNQGVHSLTELADYLPRVTAAQRTKRALAQHLPQAPGVYLFRGPADEVLYVGKSTNLQRRVRNYFTSSETRGRMAEMVGLAVRVDHVECAHDLEAGVRELRLIAAHNPPYNRRSRWPSRNWWVTLTDEPFPRLTATRAPVGARHLLGPFRSRADAAAVALTLAEECGLRTCTKRIGPHGAHGAHCPPLEFGGCPAARRGTESPHEYAAAVRAARSTMLGADDTVLRGMISEVAHLAATERFESAARLRDKAAALGSALHRTLRVTALCAIDEIVTAKPDGNGGWQVAVVRNGRLAAAGTARRGVPPLPVVDALALAAESPHPGDDTSPLRGTLAEEVRLVESWIADGLTRIVRSTSGYCEPANGPGRHAAWCAQAAASTALPALYRQ